MKIKSLDIFFIFFVLILFLLGTWQIIRLNHKNNLIENLEKNLKKNSINFNPEINKEYTKVLLKKNLLNQKYFYIILMKERLVLKL